RATSPPRWASARRTSPATWSTWSSPPAREANGWWWSSRGARTAGSASRGGRGSPSPGRARSAEARGSTRRCSPWSRPEGPRFGRLRGRARLAFGLVRAPLACCVVVFAAATGCRALEEGDRAEATKLCMDDFTSQEFCACASEQMDHDFTWLERRAFYAQHV